MKIIRKILVLTIFFVVLQSHFQSASTNTIADVSTSSCGCSNGAFKTSDTKTSPAEVAHRRRRRFDKQHQHKWKIPHLSDIKRSDSSEENHMNGNIKAGDQYSENIPSEWVLKFCFKETPLEQYMKNKMQSCKPSGTDFSCMFSSEGDSDEENSLESKFDLLGDHELRLPLKRAVEVCKEHQEKEKVSQTESSEEPSEMKQTDDSKKTIQKEIFVDPAILNKILQDLDRDDLDHRDAFNLTVATPAPQEQESKQKRRIKRMHPHQMHQFHRLSARRVSLNNYNGRESVDYSLTETLNKDSIGQNEVQLRSKCVGGCDQSDLLYLEDQKEDQEIPLIKVLRKPVENKEDIDVGDTIDVRITLNKNAKQNLDEHDRDSKMQDYDAESPENQSDIDDQKGESEVKEDDSITEDENESSEVNENQEDKAVTEEGNESPKVNENQEDTTVTKGENECFDINDKQKDTVIIKKGNESSEVNKNQEDNSIREKGNESSEINEDIEIGSCIAKEVIKVCRPKLLKALSLILN